MKPLPRYSALRVTALLVLCPFGAARAQTNDSEAPLKYGANRTNQCDIYSAASAPFSSNAVCSGAISQGTGYAASSSDNVLRSMSNHASLNATGLGMNAIAASQSSQQNSLFVTGLAPVGSNLVFHFLTSRGYSVANASRGTFGSNYDLGMATSAGFAQVSGYDDTPGNTLYLYNAVQTVSGFDLMFDFSAVTGVFDYGTYSDATAYLAGFPPSNASMAAFFDVRLTGIDAIDANGSVFGSAAFLADGNSTLDLTAPEPATLALLGVGLCVIGIAARRRRLSTL